MLKNKWEWVEFVEKWTRLGCFCWNWVAVGCFPSLIAEGRGIFVKKMGGSVSSSIKNSWEGAFLSKNGWECVVFVEKSVGVGYFSWKMGGNKLFLEKWVRAGRYCPKMGGSGSLFFENGWEWVVFLKKWVGVIEICWKWVRVAGSGWE